MCRWHWINVSQILSIQSYYVTSRSKSQMREIERYGDIINDYKKWRDTTVCAINKFDLNVWYRPFLIPHIRLQWRNFYSYSLRSIEQIILYLNTFFSYYSPQISITYISMDIYIKTYLSRKPIWKVFTAKHKAWYILSGLNLTIWFFATWVFAGNG